MFSKILIANRGEIACRVIQTAKKLGIKTVAVYSDADARSLHVTLADEAVRIGPAPVSESYLQADRIIQAALATGAQAIHPGYGFLSENPDFVEHVEKAGLVFIGPSSDAIRAMGLKDNAKALMEKAGVPIVPGYHGTEQSPKFLAKEADRIGYPVLIKARAGGGGKGMRLVERAADFADALQSAQREAQSSFGDPACLIEKFITQPRHIEVQVMGDSHGNVVHLFERDCSLQRRHQKVIEEAPAPDMPVDMREAMGSAAIEAAKAISYEGAGTVEFIVDGSNGLKPDGFWFMEMNTRLQVEHPVSEAITGLDLVELQLRVAAGEALPFAQKDLTINGHAFEARIYAEDVPAGFLPATGPLTRLNFPPDARIDTGVRQGDAVTPFYDPMIAKLTVHGPDRASALAKLRDAIAGTHIVGTKTNIAFLHALASHKGFAKGELDTGLIAQNLDELTQQPNPSIQVQLVAALCLHEIDNATLSSFRHWSAPTLYLDLDHDGEVLSIVVTKLDAQRFQIGSMVFHVTNDGETYYITSDGHLTKLVAIKTDNAVTVFADGASHAFKTVTYGGDGSAEQSDVIKAPMPGMVNEVSITAGETVTQGTKLMVLEAMKMEHALTAPRDGTIAEVLAQAGQQVDADAILIKLEPLDD